MKVYEFLIEDDDSVNKISLVKTPAIQKDFVALSKEEPIKHNFTVDEKQIVTGPALIPDKLIYRKAESLPDNEDGYIKFSKETIEKASQLYLSSSNNNNVNIEHTTDVDNVKMIESWLVSDIKNDKVNSLGIDVPEGTWMVSYKVNDDAIWSDIKSGNINGFSIEGMFSNKLISKLKQEEKEEDVFALIDSFLNS